MNNNLNTMHTFKDGFNIVRNGEIITLTMKEMNDFRYLDKAIDGRNCLEIYKDFVDDKEKEEIIEAMMFDEEICYNIEDYILDIAYQDIGIIERDVIEDYIENNKH